MDYTREMHRERERERRKRIYILHNWLYPTNLFSNSCHKSNFQQGYLKKNECLNTEAECMRRTHTFVIIKDKISVSHSFFYTNHCHLSDRKSSFSGIFLALSIILERCSLSFESTRFAANLYRKRSDLPSYK